MSIWQVRGTFHIEYGRDYADMVLAPPAPPPPLLPTSTEHSGLYLSGYIKLVTCEVWSHLEAELECAVSWTISSEQPRSRAIT